MPKRLLIACLPLALSLSAPARAAHSDWATAPQSQLRLLLEPAPGTGAALEGGIEIALDPGWYTYWRNPGDAGIPPVFDFAGSENLAGVALRYPVPERHADGAAVSLIYQDNVVFALDVTAGDPNRRTLLRVKVTYGVCRDICIPASAAAEVALAPGAAADPLAHVRLAQARARLPEPASPGRFDLTATAESDDMLVIDAEMPEASYSDLFSIPPEGWFLEQPKFASRSGGKVRYGLSLKGRPTGAAVSGQSFTFVAVAGTEAIEKTLAIP